ncbi:hypothetical protein QOT17_020772 [Balamuthia mandrillaris]
MHLCFILEGGRSSAFLFDKAKYDRMRLMENAGLFFFFYPFCLFANLKLATKNRWWFLTLLLLLAAEGVDSTITIIMTPTSDQMTVPAEFKHIIKRRKRN